MKKTALTIGFFDGVHLGHQALLQALRKKPHTTILTFENHPQSVFCPPAPKEILALEEKISLLKNFADELIILPFTKEFAETSYTDLLDQFELSHLVLGTGSSFGKKREGNETNVRAYAKTKNIHVEYIPKLFFKKEPISSSRIRRALEQNHTTLVEKLLGRPL